MARDRASGTGIGLAILLLAMVPGAAAEDDPWAELRPLVGNWEGTGAGFGTTSTVSHAWDFVLGDRFLRLQTRSVSVRGDGTEDVHEDVGYVSLDTDRGTAGMRARMRLTFNEADEYGLVLELASPGKEFAACQEMIMRCTGAGDPSP